VINSDVGASVDLSAREDGAWVLGVYTVAASQFATWVAFSLVNPFLPLFIQDLGVRDPGQLAFLSGLQVTLSSAPAFVMSPVWGAAADRFGRKPMLIRSLAAGAVTIGLTGFTTSVWQLLIVRSVQGVFASTTGACLAMASALAPPSRVAFAVGAVQAAAYTGRFVGPVIGGVLTYFFGYKTASIAGGVLMALAVLSVQFLVNERFQVGAPGTSTKPRVAANLRQLASSRELLAILVLIFAVSLGTFTTAPFLPLLVQAMPEPGSVTTVTGVALGVGSLCSAVSAFFVGRHSAHFGHARVFFISAMGAGVCTAGLAVTNSVGGLLALLAIGGIFIGGFVSAYAIASVLTPRSSQGSVYGLAASASSLGIALGPLVAGFVAPSLGLRSVFVMIGLVFVGAGGLARLWLGGNSRWR
jgi:MFS transporter, DHA1 family, multidrug resistance protein